MNVIPDAAEAVSASPLAGPSTSSLGPFVLSYGSDLSGHDYGARFEWLISTQLANKVFDRPIALAEPSLGDELLPNGHGITTTAQAELDELAKRLTGRRSRFGIF